MLSRLKEGLRDIMGELEGDLRPVWGHPQRIQAWQALVDAAQQPQVHIVSALQCTTVRQCQCSHALRLAGAGVQYISCSR